VTNGSACYYSNGTWQASVTVSGWQTGDSMEVRLCEGNNCPGSTGGMMTCSGGSCTYSGTSGVSFGHTDGAEFILTVPRPCDGYNNSVIVSMGLCTSAPTGGPQGPVGGPVILADQAGGEYPARTAGHPGDGTITANTTAGKTGHTSTSGSATSTTGNWSR
jgi:hypothetical protein